MPTTALGSLMMGSAVEAAAAIRDGSMTSTELTTAVLDRIGGSDLNAVVEHRALPAMAEAKRADEMVHAGARCGPLQGVPITIKDAFDVAGCHTTWGLSDFADHVAARDAAVVARLRAVGAIVVGKTNVATMLADSGQTDSDIYGATRNPWDRSRTPGGSSGGSAAAVSAGLSFLDYGTDLVGSIRIPAAFCGVYGLRPTPDTVPLTGFQHPAAADAPRLQSERTYISAVGPIARSAEDLRVALRATAGPEGLSAYTWNLPAPRHRRLRDFRVGVVLDDPHVPVTSAVGDRLSALVGELSAAGVPVIEGWPDGVDPSGAAECFGAHVAMFFAYLEPNSPRSVFEHFVEHERHRMLVRAVWGEYFATSADVFLCPAAFTTAFRHDDRPVDERAIGTSAGDRPYGDLGYWVAHAALPGLPVVTAPIGLSEDGLPVGAQIVGPRFEDDTAITFAELLREVAGGYLPPPVRPGVA
jgi:amidase